jgi:hypothetical protein
MDIDNKVLKIPFITARTSNSLSACSAMALSYLLNKSRGENKDMTDFKKQPKLTKREYFVSYMALVNGDVKFETVPLRLPCDMRRQESIDWLVGYIRSGLHCDDLIVLSWSELNLK